MSFRVERRFNLLIMEEGEDYIADVAATMALTRRGQVAESKGRLRICSKSLIFQPDDVAASIIKFPYRYMQVIESPANPSSSFCVECEQFVQVATKTGGTETRIVTPFSILKSKFRPSFHVHYANASEYQQLAQRLRAASKASAQEVRQILSEVTADVSFDVSRLGHRETALLPGGLWVRQVEPLLEVRGLLQLSNEAIYFQPHPNFSSEPVKQVPLNDVLHVFRRVYGVQANALEIITVHGGCLYLCFEARQCDQVEALLEQQRQERARDAPSFLRSSLRNAEGILQNVRKMTALWQSGLLSNFHYLDFLNCAAGRSRNDFSQYPVFPWVLADYTSPYLNLEDPQVFRDLSKPVGALSEKRLAYFRERMAGMPENQERFLYGTHYSTPAYVIYWLLRSMPERMLRLHNGHFDAWARLFRSVKESWDSVNESTASLMELIPEFFVLPADWLQNSLGITTPEHPLGDVELPRWAKDVPDFISKMRAALESDFVSQQLPAWVDLIFGCKQSGEAAVKADNLFHPVCYAGSKGPEEVASFELPMDVLETQLQEFGRMPQQLFFEPHPPRLRIPKWPISKLQEPGQSEPWYNAVRSIKETDGTLRDLSVLEAGKSANGYSQAVASTTSPPRGSTDSWRSRAGTVAGLRKLSCRAVAPFPAGSITGMACCSENLYAVGEDGCLRVSPLPGSEGQVPSLRRNFRISPMPLSAIAVLDAELLALGGHDNAVALYSTSCGSALSRSQMHADTVTCLGASPCRSMLVSGSRDQSVVLWAVSPSGLKNDVIFDDLQQPVVCCSCSGPLVLAACDRQLMAWDRRSGQVILDRELDSVASACALSDAAASASGCLYAAALDNCGELRFWDLRQVSESLRLQTTSSPSPGLVTANCFLTDFSSWAVLGGAAPTGHPAMVLWDIPQQREMQSWTLDEPSDSGNSLDIRFLLKPPAKEDMMAWKDDVPMLCASSSGRVYAFTDP
ncbi:unnamed protein product [Effrenium voratum]|nr:unnamed protein product [Effrenium voratum]